MCRTRAKLRAGAPSFSRVRLGGEVLDLQQPPAEIGLFLSAVAGGTREAATIAFESGEGPFDGIETLRQEGVFSMIDDRVHRSFSLLAECR